MVTQDEAAKAAAAELRNQLRDGVAGLGLDVTQVARRSGLGRTTVSQALNAEVGVPSERTLAALGRALRLNVTSLLELRRAACATQPPDLPEGPGLPIAAWDALDLEVHPAGGQRYTGAPLPAYIWRQHDDQLARVTAAAAEGRSAMVVLVGSSSTGKTRACWEAVQPLSELGWRLWHPFDPTRAKAALAGLAQVGPRTVVWLNEAQHYLDTGEEMAAAIHALLSDPERSPVLVLGTLWPEYDQVYAKHPTFGQPDPHTRTRELLAGRRIVMPGEFDEPALSEARRLASAGDPYLTDVLARDHGGRITQYLAGAPELLRRYASAEPAAQAIIKAAVDARRLGVALHLPQVFLAEAVSDYLNPDESDALSEDWFERAVSQLAEPVHGGFAPLLRVRQRMTPRLVRESSAAEGGSGPTYRLADYLEQHGRGERHLDCPPQSFWDAALTHVNDHVTLHHLGKAASARGRFQCADALYRRAAEAGSAEAASDLAHLRERKGDIKEAEALFRRAGELGDYAAMCGLVLIWAHAGRLDEAEDLALVAAEAGYTHGLCDLAWRRERDGDRSAAEALYQRAATAGDHFATHELMRFREEAGDGAEAERLALGAVAVGNPFVADKLTQLREQAGDHAGAERFAQLAADAGHPGPLYELGRLRQEAGHGDQALELFQRAADAGSTTALYEVGLALWTTGDREGAERSYELAGEHAGQFAAHNLVVTREKAGDSTGAEAAALRAAQAGDPGALTSLARMREQHGDRAGAETLYQSAIEAGETNAMVLYAEMLTATDAPGAERLLLLAANAAQHSALPGLARLWQAVGNPGATTVERYGLDPDGKPSRPW